MARGADVAACGRSAVLLIRCPVPALHQPLVAGRDTTANCLIWVFYELHRNPEILARVREELDTQLAGRSPTYEDITSRLPYMHAVVQETLRLYPSVPKVGVRRRQCIATIEHSKRMCG